MNIRNLLLTLTIFCAAPVVCVEPEINLTKQEKETIKKWIQEINIKNQHPITQQAVKFIIISKKNQCLVNLNKMLLGKSKVIVNNEMNQENKAFDLRLPDECKEFMWELIRKDSRINKQQCGMICKQVIQLM